MYLFGRRDYGIKKVEWFELCGRVAVTSVGYPFEYVKVLIQLGHEPLPPKPTTTFFGRPALALPGAWTYMKHIKQVDGFLGLYRGLFSKICTNLVSGITYTVMLDRLPSIEMEPETSGEETERELTEEQKILQFVHRLIRESVSRCTAVIISQPFQVITIRTMAQFVGKEEKYCGIFSSLAEIYRQNGISGFFSGLIPRIIGEILTLWVAGSVSFFINSYIIEEKTLKAYIKASTVYLASSLFYPFVVVSNVVSVNNCGLAAGMPPNMPIYSSWTDCWSHLNAIGQLKRGSAILIRYYNGPYLDAHRRKPKFV